MGYHQNIQCSMSYNMFIHRLEHPVKRFKPTEAYFREELLLGGCEGDLYAGHEHTRMAPHHHADVKQEKQDHVCILRERPRGPPGPSRAWREFTRYIPAISQLETGL